LTPYLLPTSPWTAWRIVSTAAAWPMASQQHARHNALVASAALTQQRQERLDVEEFLADRASRRDETVARTDAGHFTTGHTATEHTA
jgi:hypothetical protein